VSVSPPTANRWLDWLKKTFLWIDTPPYFTNAIKRISKHPKGNLFDTGVICSLLKISDAESLAAHPAVGALFETAMRLEFQAVIDSFLLPAEIYHWRTSYGKEVDIVIEHRNKLFAFECKWTSSPDVRDLNGLLHLKETFQKKTAFLGVLTPAGPLRRIHDDIFQIPWVRA
jgi:uncharacterized protein